MPILSYTLKKHNVTLVSDSKGLVLQCNKCGVEWSVNSNNRLPRGYWKCLTNKCNFTEKTFKHTTEVRAFLSARNRKQRSKKAKP